MATQTISNSDDVIDSRDIIARIEELEPYDYKVCPECGCTEGDEHDEDCSQPEPVDNLDESDKEELTALLALQDECEGYVSDWKYGETLIRDSYFENYARELAEDVGDIPRELRNQWPFTCIDWEQAAEELKQDYTSAEFDGVTYWVRM
jgi:hypothetical protein